MDGGVRIDCGDPSAVRRCCLTRLCENICRVNCQHAELEYIQTMTDAFFPPIPPSPLHPATLTPPHQHRPVDALCSTCRPLNESDVSVVKDDCCCSLISPCCLVSRPLVLGPLCLYCLLKCLGCSSASDYQLLKRNEITSVKKEEEEKTLFRLQNIFFPSWQSQSP